MALDRFLKLAVDDGDEDALDNGADEEEEGEVSYSLDQVRNEWYEQNPPPSDGPGSPDALSSWPREVFNDFIIVTDNAGDDFYRVRYTVDDNANISFQNPEKVKIQYVTDSGATVTLSASDVEYSPEVQDEPMPPRVAKLLGLAAPNKMHKFKPSSDDPAVCATCGKSKGGAMHQRGSGGKHIEASSAVHRYERPSNGDDLRCAHGGCGRPKRSWIHLQPSMAMPSGALGLTNAVRVIIELTG